MSISYPQSLPYFFVTSSAGFFFNFQWNNANTSIFPITINDRTYNVTMLGTFVISKVSLHFRLYEILEKADINSILSYFSEGGFNVKILIDRRKETTDLRVWK